MINTDNLISKLFTKHLKPIENENEYNPTPRIQSTVKPNEEATVNGMYDVLKENRYKDYKNTEL